MGWAALNLFLALLLGLGGGQSLCPCAARSGGHCQTQAGAQCLAPAAAPADCCPMCTVSPARLPANAGALGTPAAVITVSAASAAPLPGMPLPERMALAPSPPGPLLLAPLRI